MSDPHPEPADADKPVGELAADMTSKLTTLLRRELDLAVIELKDEMKQAIKAGGILGAGGLMGYFSLFFASLALAWLLDAKLPRFMAFFLVAALQGGAAAALLVRGRQEIQQVDPIPQQTVDTLKENLDWAKAQTN